MWITSTLLAGCVSLSGKGHEPRGGPDEHGPPALIPESPARAAWVDDGTVVLTGVARGMDHVTLDGNPVSMALESYLASTVIERGIGTFDLVGTEKDGTAHEVVYSVIAGETASTDGRIEGAIAVHAGAEAIEGLAPLVESLLDPASLLGTGSGTPVVDDGQYTVYIDGVTIGGIGLRAIPTDGSLLFGVELQDLVVDLTVEASVLFIPIELQAHLLVNDAELLTELVLGTDGQGGLTVEVERPQLHFQSVEVDVEDIADFIEDLFLSDDDAQQMLEDELDGLTDQIPQLVEGLLADLDEMTTIETDLLGTPLALAPYIASARVTPDGVDLGIDFDLTVGDGAPAKYLRSDVPPAPGGTGLAVVLSDDLVNRALTDLWAGGALNLDLPIEPGSVESAILLLFGGAGGAGELKITAGLPPVLVEQDGEARIEVGEWVLAIDVPGGKYGDHLELGLHGNLGADFLFDGASIGVGLHDAQLTLVPLGDDPDPALVEAMPNITAGMTAGIGLLNGMLSFPLDGMLGGTTTTGGTTTGEPGGLLDGIALPPMAFTRDPSHLGTRIDAELVGWDPSAE
jgi:hypothetical protein